MNPNVLTAELPDEDPEFAGLSRMDRAMKLGETCWQNAMSKSPEFVGAYLKVAEAVLMARPSVAGCDFRAECRKAGVALPKSLHHNVWVSGPKFLESLGWIKKAGKVEPKKMHNHMDSVTLWISLLYPASNDPEPFLHVA